MPINAIFDMILLNRHEDVLLNLECLLLNNQNIDIDELAFDGRTALLWAIDDSMYDVAELLLKHGADATLESPLDGSTALSLLLKSYAPPCVRRIHLIDSIIENGGDVNSHTNRDSFTPLMTSCSIGTLEYVRILLHHGADVNFQSKSHGSTGFYFCFITSSPFPLPLYLFIISTYLPICLPMFLSLSHTYKRYLCVFIHTALILACSSHEKLMFSCSSHHKMADVEAIVNLLIQHGLSLSYFLFFLPLSLFISPILTPLPLAPIGADVNAQSNSGLTALFQCLHSGQLWNSVAETLILHDTDVNIKNNRGMTALHLASSVGNHHITKLLISKYANLHDFDESHMTALMHAVAAGHDTVVNILLANGASVHDVSHPMNRSVLQLGISGGNIDVLKKLIRNGALLESPHNVDTNIKQTVSTYTILKWHTSDINKAIYDNDMSTLRLLLKRESIGEHLSKVDEYGWTALHVACYLNNETAVKLLLKRSPIKHLSYSAQTNCVESSSCNSHTIWHMVCNKGYHNILRLLLHSTINMKQQV